MAIHAFMVSNLLYRSGASLQAQNRLENQDVKKHRKLHQLEACRLPADSRTNLKLYSSAELSPTAVSSC
jgi:hypothetical protein